MAISKKDFLDSLSYFRQKLTGAPAVDEISDVEWKNILGEFTERVNHFCKVMDVTVGRITIRNQKTR